MRDRDTDPTTTAALAEIDAAVAGSPDADPELLTLAEDLRATRPEPSAAFSAQVERRLDHGFEPPRPRRTRLRLVVPAGATVLAMSIAAIAVFSSGGDNPVEGPPASEPSSVQAERGAAKSAGEASGDTAAPTVVVPGPVPQPGEAEESSVRQVERGASLTLAAPDGDVQKTTDRVVQTTARLGGYVLQSNLSVTGDRGSASLTLRVPTERLDDAIAALARLGKVRAIDQRQQDITSVFNAAQAELDEARAERQGLLSALRRSSDESQIARLRVRLRENAQRIKNADANLTSAKSRASRATIDVQVVDGENAVPEPREQGFGIERAAELALGVLSTSAGVLLLVAAAAIPLIALTAIALLAARGARRRSREQALDRSPEQDGE